MSGRLQDRLVFQAQQRPESCAIVWKGRQTSYGELEQASNQLARALRACGCARGDRVALLLPKSPEALIAMFGAMKADCVYVPLDTASPAARLGRILASCESRVVLAAGSSRGLLEQLTAQGALHGSTRVGWMENGKDGADNAGAVFSWDDVRREPASSISSANEPSAPAHILFTSGSTGTPKGVVITHANVTHFVDWAVRYFGMDSSDRVSCHAPLHFDLSTFDIHGAMAVGAQIHLVPPELNLLPHRLAAFIRDSWLTQWFSVPSVLNLMAQWDAVRAGDFPAMRRVLWCGEKFPTPGLMYWMRRLSRPRFFNLYGPTETTVASSCYFVERCPEDETEEIPIGDPCGGEQLLVLNENLQPAAHGDVGDLYIAGVGLSPGYWRDAERTRQAFIANPSQSGGFQRIYRTGDLARIGSDGRIYLVGRSDSQIKSRGYRIELGEIEAAVHAVPGVAEAAVVAIEAPDIGNAICCAYHTIPGRDVSPSLVKNAIGRLLPPYMTPSHWMLLDEMPRNANGKVDRPKIRDLFRKRQNRRAITKEAVSVA